jgi:hypothetical protein
MNGDIDLTSAQSTCAKRKTAQSHAGSASRNLGSTKEYMVTIAKSDFPVVNPNIAAARAPSSTSVYHRVTSAGAIRAGGTRFAKRHTFSGVAVALCCFWQWLVEHAGF